MQVNIQFDMAALFSLLLSTCVASLAAAAALHDGVHFFSIQMTESDKTYNAPTLPELVKSLGLNALYDSVVKAKLADALSSKGR